jgi:TRAP-type C4-dicarboxylate transport system permease small subunit
VKAVSLSLLVVAALAGAAGAWIYVTERGAANEIKGFVLLLIAAVLAIGGCLLWELRAIRRELEQRHPK